MGVCFFLAWRLRSDGLYSYSHKGSRAWGFVLLDADVGALGDMNDGINDLEITSVGVLLIALLS